MIPSINIQIMNYTKKIVYTLALIAITNIYGMEKACVYSDSDSDEECAELIAIFAKKNPTHLLRATQQVKKQLHALKHCPPLFQPIARPKVPCPPSPQPALAHRKPLSISVKKNIWRQTYPPIMPIHPRITGYLHQSFIR